MRLTQSGLISSVSEERRCARRLCTCWIAFCNRYSAPRLDACSKVFSAANIPVSWITPTGLAVSQPYFEEDSRVVKTALQSVTLKQKNIDGPVDGGKQKQGFPPNFVHSLDGSHMLLTARRLIGGRHKPWSEEPGGERIDFAAVHDSFWTHPCDVDIMNRVLREEFVKLHERPIMAELDENFRLALGRRKAAELPPRPEATGTLDLRVVMDSPYFFD